VSEQILGLHRFVLIRFHDPDAFKGSAPNGSHIDIKPVIGVIASFLDPLERLKLRLQLLKLRVHRNDVSILFLLLLLLFFQQELYLLGCLRRNFFLVNMFAF